MEDDKRKILYDQLTKDGYDLGDYDSFSNNLKDSNKVKSLYDTVTKDGYDLGDYNSFNSKISGQDKSQVTSQGPAPVVQVNPQVNPDYKKNLDSTLSNLGVGSTNNINKNLFGSDSRYSKIKKQNDFNNNVSTTFNQVVKPYVENIYKTNKEKADKKANSVALPGFVNPSSLSEVYQIKPADAKNIIDKASGFIDNSFKDKDKAEALKSNLYNYLVDKQVPKSSLDYILKNAGNNSVIGSLARLASGESQEQQQINQLANEKYNPSSIEQGVAGAAGMILDTPVFTVAGGLGGLVEKGAAKTIINSAAKQIVKGSAENVGKELATQQASRAFATETAKHIAQRASLGAINQATTFSLYNATNDVINQAIGINNGAQEKFNFGELGKTMASGAAMGAVLGSWGRAYKINAPNIIGKVGQHAAKFSGELGIFTAMSSAEKAIEGQPVDLTQELLTNTAQLLALKASNPSALFGFVKSLKNESPSIRESNLEEYKFTPEESDELKTKGFDPDQLYSQIGKLSASTEPNKDVDLFINSTYAKIMRDPDISLKAKGKLMYIVEGQPSFSVTTGYKKENVNGNVVLSTLDPTNSVIERKRFGSNEEADKYIEDNKLDDRIDISKTSMLEDLNDRYVGSIYINQAINDTSRDLNLSVDDISSIIAKKSSGEKISKEENDILDKIKQNLSRNRDYVSKTASSIAERVSDKYGLNIAQVSEKPIKERTDKEQEAIDTYNSLLSYQIPKNAYSPNGDIFGNGFWWSAASPEIVDHQSDISKNTGIQKAVASPEDKHDVKSKWHYMGYKLMDLFGEQDAKDIMDFFGEDSSLSYLLEVLKDNANYPPEKLDAIVNYYNAKKEYDGLVEGIGTNIDGKVDDLRKKLSDNINENNRIETLRDYDGNMYYLLSGEIATTPDSNSTESWGNIDVSKSSNVIYIRDKDGNISISSPKKFETYTLLSNNPSQFLDEQSDIYRNKLLEDERNNVDYSQGIPDPVIGNVITISGNDYVITDLTDTKIGLTYKNDIGTREAAIDYISYDEYKQILSDQIDSSKVNQINNTNDKSNLTSQDKENKEVPPKKTAQEIYDSIPEENGKKQWEQSSPEDISQYIIQKTKNNKEKSLDTVEKMIQQLSDSKEKMDAIDSLDVDDKIDFWNNVKESINQDFFGKAITEEDVNKQEAIQKALDSKKSIQKPIENKIDIPEEYKDYPDVVDVLKDETPTTPEEFAADFISRNIGKDGYKIATEDAVGGSGIRSMTGYGKIDTSRYVGLFLKPENGGVPFEAFAEKVATAAREEGYNFDDGNAMFWTNVLQELFHDNGTKGEIMTYSKRMREERARNLYDKIIEEENNAKEAYCQEKFNMDADEYDMYHDNILDILKNEALSDDEVNELNSILAEKYKENGEEPKPQSADGIRQESDSVLQEEKPLSSGTAGEVKKQSEGPDGNVDNEHGVVPESQSGEISNDEISSFSNEVKKISEVEIKKREKELSPLEIEEIENRTIEELAKEKGMLVSANKQYLLYPKDVNRDDVEFTTHNTLNDSVIEILDKISLYNSIFKDSDYKLLGFEKEGKGIFPIFMRYEPKDTRPATFKEEESYMSSLGFKREGLDFYNDKYIISDLRNVRVFKDGKIYVEDAEIKTKNNLKEVVKQANEEVNTSPTEAQKEAGNYKKGHIQVGSFDISIENPEGSIRSGVDQSGKKWETKMNNTYGYIRGTKGVDGDHIDVFISKDIDGWNGRKIFVVDQYNEDGTFDEHKVMLGFNNIDDAESNYYSNYSSGWKEKHPNNKITGVNIEDFEKWVDSSTRKTKAFSDYSSITPIEQKGDIIKEKPTIEQLISIAKGDDSLPETKQAREELSKVGIDWNEKGTIEDANKNRLKAIEQRYVEIDDRKMELGDIRKDLGDNPDPFEIARIDSELYSLEKEQRDLEDEYSGIKSLMRESNVNEKNIDYLKKDNNENDNFVENSTNEKKVSYKTQKGKEIKFESLPLFPDEAFDSGRGTDKIQREKDLSKIRLRKLEDGEVCSVERIFRKSKGFNFVSRKQKIESVDDVAYIFDQLENSAIENVFLAMTKDGKSVIVHLGMGTLNQSLVDFSSIKASIDSYKPDKVYFVHNHPSGNVEASKQDVDILSRIRPMIKDKSVLQDGIIIDTKRGIYGTFNDTDSSKIKKEIRESGKYPIDTFTFDTLVFSKDFIPDIKSFHDSSDIASFISSQRLGDRKKISYLILDNSNKAIGNIHTPYVDTISHEDEMADDISSTVTKFGGSRAVLYGNFDLNESSLIKIGSKISSNTAKVVSLLDVLHIDGLNQYKSANDENFLGEKNEKYNVDNKKSDIQFRESKENVPSSSTNKEDIKSEVEKLSKSLNKSVELVSDKNSLPENGKAFQAIREGRNIKGWFDTKTGKVYIYTPNVDNVGDVQKTYLHEVVGHFGLRNLVGKDNYDTFCNNIFKSMSDEMKDRFAYDSKGNRVSNQKAADEYMANMAETQIDPTFWGKVKGFVKDMFRKIGIDLKMKDPDIQYMLWKSRNKLRSGNVFDYAGDISAKRAFDNYTIFREEDGRPRRSDFKSYADWAKALNDWKKNNEEDWSKINPAESFRKNMEEAERITKEQNEEAKHNVQMQINEAKRKDPKNPLRYQARKAAISGATDEEKEAATYLANKIELDISRDGLNRMWRDEKVNRRIYISSETYKTRMLIDDIKSSTTKQERSVIPFIIEGTYEGKIDENLANQVEKVRSFFQNIYDNLQLAGALYGSGRIDNYVTHIWDRAKTPKEAWNNMIKLRSRYTKPRIIESYAEGIALGLVPKYTDITDIMKDYSKETNITIANKRILDFLKNVSVEVDDKNGGDIRQKDILIPIDISDSDYGTVKNEALRQYGVLKSMIPEIETIFGEGPSYKYKSESDLTKADKGWRMYDMSNSVFKRLRLSLSAFHAYALAEKSISAVGIVDFNKTILKRMIWDTIKTQKLPTLRDKETTMDAVSHLVQLGVSNDYDPELRIKELTDSLKSNNHNKIANTLNILSSGMDKANKAMDVFLWDFVHDSLKIYAYKHFAEQVRKEARKNNYSEETVNKMLITVGMTVNNMFGGQHWELLGMSPKELLTMRRILLSGDWNASVIREMTALFGVNNVKMKALNGSPIYDAKDFNGEKDGTNIALGNITRKMTQKQLIAFWARAAVWLGLIGSNMVNVVRRKEDVDNELTLAQERRKVDPNYSSPYEVKYPDGMKWYDYTMYGNAEGQRSHLFWGRNNDQTENYARWGKSFREILELIDGRNSHDILQNIIDKIVGKLSPNISNLAYLIGDETIGGFKSSEEKKKENKNPFEKWGSRVMHVIGNNVVPWSVSSLISEDNSKSWGAIDLIMPTSKGMSPYKAKRLMEDYMEVGDIGSVAAVYDSAVMNKLDADKLIDAAISSVLATQKSEFSDGIKDVSEAADEYNKETDIKKKKIIGLKLSKMLSETDFKDYQKEESMNKLNESFGPNPVSNIKEERYIRLSNDQDIKSNVDMYRIVKMCKDKYDKYKDLEGTPEGNEYYNKNKFYIQTKIRANTINSTIGRLKRSMNDKNEDEIMQEIRSIKRDFIKSVESIPYQ